MWSYLIHLYNAVDATPFALIWVLLLIESLFNKRIRGFNKVWWFIFIAWTHIFGAALYFFFGPSQLYLSLFGKAKPRYQPPTPAQRQPSASTQRQSTPPQFYQQVNQNPPAQPTPTYPDYQQGYTPRIYVPTLLPQETQYVDPQYEQPQATYPEMTQEQ